MSKGGLKLAILGAAIVAPFLSTVWAAEVFVSKCDLVIAGPINASDDKEFQRQLTALLKQGCGSPRVYLYSSGGDMGAAIRIGEQIHLLHLTTIGPVLYERGASAGENDKRVRDGPRICELLPGSAQRAKLRSQITDDHALKVIEALKRKMPLPKSPHVHSDFNPKTAEGDARCACASACFFIWAAGAERKGDVLEIHRPYIDPRQFAQFHAGRARTEYLRTRKGLAVDNQ